MNNQVEILNVHVLSILMCVFSCHVGNSPIGSRIYVRPIPTKWEASHTISCPSYDQIIHIVKIFKF